MKSPIPSGFPRAKRLLETAAGNPPPEPMDVLFWRYEQLRRAGWPTELALDVAPTRVDLHRACELVQAGCSPERAKRILL